MIGTGVFTSLGFQVGVLPSGFVILSLWFIGGISALCGALCYGELAATLPRSGGEYHFLSRTIHPSVGFLGGWLSATIGFAAPIALATMALGKYAVGLGINMPGGPEFLGLLIVALLTGVHLSGLRIGALFQNATTLLKLTLVVMLVIAGCWVGKSQPITFLPARGDTDLLLSGSFAASLVYVMYAYSGWNAATYIVGEIRDPARNVPRALIIGTTLVAALYLLLNMVFLWTTPVGAMRGNIEVGLIAGEYIFGATGGRIVGAFICIGLIASISAMTWIGPRVVATMGEDLAALRWLAARTQSGIPRTALLAQFLIVAFLIVTSTFEKVLVYVQFGLTLFSFLTVAGLVVLRWREPHLPRPFRTPAYPLPAVLFLAISGWMLWNIAAEKPQESLAGLATIAAGLVIYALSPKATSPRIASI